MIAIITARGGSRRIPRKNIRVFMGRPMLAYAIEAAQKSDLFEEIMVSTDDREIADTALRYGARVPFMRSAQTANDTATTFDVLDEVLATYRQAGRQFDTLCCIYPCVPFLRAATLRHAYEAMARYDAVVPVCRYPAPVEWAMKIEDGLLIPQNREAQNRRSQDLVPTYFDAGMFYFCKTAAFYRDRSLIPAHTVGYVIDESECQDIDTPEDWAAAEMKYRILYNYWK